MAAARKKSTAKKASTKKASTKKASTTKASTTKASTTKAASKSASGGRPRATKSAATRAPTKQAAATKPAATKPAAKKSASTRSAATRSAAGKSAGTKTARTTRRTPHPPTPKSTTRKMAGTPKTMTTKTTTTKTTTTKTGTTKTGTTDTAELPKPRFNKDGFGYTKDFDLSFVKQMHDALQEERVRLTGQAKRLEDEAHQLVEEAEMGDVQFDDEGGEGDTMVVERERDLALSAQAREAVTEIDAALDRIKAGSYGYSVVSGRPIPKERLEAIPWATVLVEEKVGGIGRR
jgi:RNA polymerase-binding transcription factor DksA